MFSPALPPLRISEPVLPLPRTIEPAPDARAKAPITQPFEDSSSAASSPIGQLMRKPSYLRS